ncbi:methionine ABC transporter permease [Campylobacter californiensis]|uniref:methionine ABC transporter permease n=1 Tax=Campylobacter californiensis TaxID=1032243 RepID=UPI00301574E9
MRDIPWSEIIDRIIFPAILNTLQMLFFCFIFSAILGFAIAVMLYMSKEDRLRPNKTLYTVLNGGISILRSFPFMILMVSIIPLTRIITGSSIGWVSALVPLTVASTPFMARMFENAIKEVNPALVDAAKSFGASDMQIIFCVVLVDALTALITGCVLSIIHVLNLTTVAGAIGAGGLGARLSVKQ